jgi:hypothetical protein
MAKVPYPLFCAVLGAVLGVLPSFFHGPIPEKWSYFNYGTTAIDGATLVWGYYIARGLIGVLVGTTVWPGAWFLRGPLCGVVMMVPLGVVALANPLCGGV